MAPIRFGFLLVPYQLTDVAAPMDILAWCSSSLLDEFPAPESIKKAAVEIEFLYIGLNYEPVETSTNCFIKPTNTLDDCPKLDYLLVGGPNPPYALSVPEDFKKFIRDKRKEVKTLFSTCTGGLVLAAAGVLDGFEATTNHVVVPFGREYFPNVKWRDDKSWIVSDGGRLWTSAGAIKGMEMIIEWSKQHFGEDVVNNATAMLDFQPRDADAKLIGT